MWLHYINIQTKLQAIKTLFKEKTEEALEDISLCRVQEGLTCSLLKRLRVFKWKTQNWLELKVVVSKLNKSFQTGMISRHRAQLIPEFILVASQVKILLLGLLSLLLKHNKVHQN